MKIILSRKGFDSKAGGVPNPILPDGTLLSLPIPAKNDSLTYSDLVYGGVSYADLLAQLKPKDNKIRNWNCHLDPDIRENTRKNQETNWIAAFGQCDAPQSYLVNQGIEIGDIFLFFGWFRQTEGDIHKGTLRYLKGAPDLHVIYGYLQVGEILKNPVDLTEKCPWHPHASNRFTNKTSNAIYLPTKLLSLDETRNGYGTFSFSEKRVLTMSGRTRATWEEKPSLMPDNINRNVKNSAKNGGVYYAGQWQELVLKDSISSIDFLKTIF